MIFQDETVNLVALGVFSIWADNAVELVLHFILRRGWHKLALSCLLLVVERAAVVLHLSSHS